MSSQQTLVARRSVWNRLKFLLPSTTFSPGPASSTGFSSEMFSSATKCDFQFGLSSDRPLLLLTRYKPTVIAD